jgi:RND family efflux transporter MFP subunit
MRFIGQSVHFKFIFLFLLLFSFSEPGYAQQQAPGPPPSPVVTAPVKERSVSETLTLVGTTEPVRTSKVAAEVSGIVEAFPVNQGDFIKAGNLIVELRSNALQLRLKEAMAERERISANLALAEKELGRISKLRETQSVSQKIFDDAYYEHLALQKNLAASQASIEVRLYELKQKRVLAPFSGFIAEEHIEIGEWLQEGGKVITLVDLSEIFVTADVPEKYAIMLSLRESIRVYFPSLSEEPVDGIIEAILPQGDPMARTIPVRIKMKNTDYKLKGGMEARVSFNLPGFKNALLVPKDAVVSSGQTRLVWIAAGGTVQPSEITILGYFDGNAAVEGNLNVGDLVVVRGNERLRPGQAVQVTEK